MAKEKISMTLDPQVVKDTDADADASGCNRSEYVERVLRDAHYARLLAMVATRPPISEGEARTLRAVMAWQQDPSLPAPAAPGRAA